MDVIKYPIYPILKSGDVVIWDSTNFEKSDKNELLTSNDILQPKKRDDNYLTFCKCDFNVKSLIYEKAKPEDILSGWIAATEGLKLGRLIKLFLRDSLYNLYLTKHLHEELDMILVLRLVYWFYRCSRLNSNDTFKYKITEVKRKLTKGLLNQREKINRQLNHHTNNITIVNTLVSELEQTISQFRNNKDPDEELQERFAKYRETWFKDVWNVTAELLLASVCGENGFNVTFETSSTDHDYDFIVNGYPVQVKSLNIGYDSVRDFANAKQKRKEYVDSGRITQDIVINKILDAINYNIGSIDKALKQQAKIIFLNGTTDESGSFFSQLCLQKSNSNSFSIKKSLITSIDLIKKNNRFVPLVFCATGFRLRYYINALTFKIPVIYSVGYKMVDRGKQIEVL